MKIQHLFKMFSHIILDFIYPRHCAICSRTVTACGGVAICSKCRDMTPVCKVVRDDRFFFDEAIGVLKYDSTVKDAMLKYKFKSVRYYAGAYAHVMNKATADRPYLKQTLMCCVPVSKSRNRDYSQTEIIARELSVEWGIDFIPDLLCRTKPVAQLSKMKLPERKFYIHGSIDVNPCYDVYGKDVLVIDDIYTSGTTANECARMLKMYGALHVFVLCPCYD